MRHKWWHGRRYMVCERCSVRYRTGMITREYEWPFGMRSSKAGECGPNGHEKTPEWEIWKDYYAKQPVAASTGNSGAK